MVAEERITTKFSGLVGAYGTEEEATFLATQQVDEARHMQFYARYQDEVVADPATIADHVAARAPRSSPPPSARSSTSCSSRRTSASPPSPATRAAKVEFVTLYHMVIEGTLGLTAFNFITRYLERLGPAAGLRRRATRRSTTTSSATSATAPGSCARRSAATPRSATASATTLRAAAARRSPRRSPRRTATDTDWEALGASSEEIRDFAISAASTRRLNIVGVPLDSL